MKKYIIIMLSFLSLLFINVGIVSADDKVSSKLTSAQIKEINKAVQEAGIPIDHREELFSKYKKFTDYVIFIPRSEFYGNTRNVQMYLYTRSKKDPYGWSGESWLDTDITEYMQYDLKYDKTKKKWYWFTYGDYPSPKNTLGINGYIINATETITKNIDDDTTFFPQRSPLDLAWGVTKIQIQQKMFQLWQNLVPYGIILLASWVSWVMLYKVLRHYLAV